MTKNYFSFVGEKTYYVFISISLLSLSITAVIVGFLLLKRYILEAKIQVMDRHSAHSCTDQTRLEQHIEKEELFFVILKILIRKTSQENKRYGYRAGLSSVSFVTHDQEENENLLETQCLQSANDSLCFLNNRP